MDDVLRQQILHDVFDWKYEMSGPGYLIYSSNFHGVLCKLATDGKSHCFERRRRGGKSTKFATAQDLLASFPKVTISE